MIKETVIKKGCKSNNAITVLFVVAMITVTLSIFCIGCADKTYAANINCEYLSGSNVEKQNYIRYSSPSWSYLTKVDAGYMRVQATEREKDVSVVYYDNNFNTVERKTVKQELPYFGAFYESDANYYLVTGDSNKEENNSKEVFRITKYDKSWRKLSDCGMFGANTVYPFDAGSCRVDMTDNYMVIRTCHEMYKGLDGLNHQANVTMLVNVSTMKVVDSFTGVMNPNYGYVSHSFNQFVKLENNKIISVDHGDAHPRAIVLMKYPKDITTGAFQSNSVHSLNVMNFPGSIGDNSTGASIGGFEITGSGYLIAGNTVLQDTSNTRRSTRNVFVSFVNPSGAVNTKQLTNYAEGEATTRTPHLVKINSNKYMVLWSRDDKVYYCTVDGSGNTTSGIYSMDGSLSDCAPIVDGSNVVWYTWNNGDEKLYKISASNLNAKEVIEKNYTHDYKWLRTIDGEAFFKCNKCHEEKSGRAPISFYNYWKRADDTGMYYYSRIPVLDIEECATIKYMYSDIKYNENIVSTERYGDFEFVSDKPGKTTVNQGKSEITFSEAGIYKIRVYPKYNPEVSRTYTFKVTKPLTGVKVSTDQKIIPFGNSVTLTATADGGKGTIEYSFIVITPNGKEVKLYADSHQPSYSWKPDSVGTYKIKVVAVDTDDGGRSVSSPFINCTVEPAEAKGKDVYKIPESMELDDKTAEAVIDYAKKNNIDISTIKITDKTITALKSDKDIKGAKFSVICPYIKKQTKKTMTLKWVKVKGASGYVVYGNRCNVNGKKYNFKKLATLKGNSKLTWTNKKLKKGVYYKYMVIAYRLINNKKITIANGPILHGVTLGGKYCVAKSVKIVKVGTKKNAKKITLKKGEKAKIVASEVKAKKKLKLSRHRGLSYESTNPEIATVTKKGIVKAIKKGKCAIYVYAQNGINKKITVMVK